VAVDQCKEGDSRHIFATFCLKVLSIFLMNFQPIKSPSNRTRIIHHQDMLK